MLIVGTVVVLLAATPVGVAPAADGSGCAVIDSIGQCLVSAVDPGRPGGPREQTRGPAAAAAPPAVARPAGPTPAGLKRQELEAARLPADLRRMRDAAPGTVPGAAASAALAVMARDQAAAPAPDPRQTLATLTRQSLERLTLDPPALHTSAGASGLVGVPMWLWIDAAAAEPVTTTAAAGAAVVTATARLTAVTWEMGPPGEVVRCAGPGTPWTGGGGPSPDCGYVYELRSLLERTAGRGTWTITATCTWTVTFTGMSAGAPVADEQAVSVATSAELPVGEVQVLVGGDGS